MSLSNNVSPNVHFKGTVSGSGHIENFNGNRMIFNIPQKIPVGATLEFTLKPPDEIFFLTADGIVIEVKQKNGFFQAEVEFFEGQKGFASLTDRDESHSGKMDRDIIVPAKIAYQTICDFESYPQWQAVVKKVKILKKENFRPKIVQFTFYFLVKKVILVNEYFYDDENHQLEWRTISGEIKEQTGSYKFMPKRDGGCLAEFKISVRLGFKVPKIIIDWLKKNTMYLSLGALKKEAEKRYNAQTKNH